GWPAYAGMFVPLSVIVLVLAQGASLGVGVLAIGTAIGLCLEVCVLVYRMRRAKLSYRPVLHLRDKHIPLILGAAWPVLLGSSIGQMSPLIDQMFASLLTVGSISALSYSTELISVPAGVIFLSVGRAALPYFARQIAIEDMRGFKATLRVYVWVA